MLEMNRWELDCATRSRQERQGELSTDEEYRIANEELEDVFRAFCKHRPKRGVVFRKPPEYDPDAENILNVVEESSTCVKITTQQTTGFERKCVYELRSVKGEWLIARKGYYDVDGAIVRVNL
jgi:hypothetical protein